MILLIRLTVWFLAVATLASPVLNAQGRNTSEDVKLTARYHIETNTKKGYLIVRVDVAEGSHIYSLKQGKPLTPSKIEIEKSKLYEVAKQFLLQQSFA